jgi:two-component system catabolic regulation response regulator CreB
MPMMFLTNRDSPSDEVAGMEMGADGYLKKPIVPRVVAAHVKAMLRRIDAEAAADEEPEDEREDIPQGKSHPDFRVDTSETVIYYKGIQLELSRGQYTILSKMIPQPRRVFPVEVMLDWVNPDGTATEQSVYSYIYRLRQILKSVAPGERFFRNHHHNGYSLI